MKGVAPTNLSSDWLDDFEERAAIREYEGGFDRAEAECLAWTDVLQEKACHERMDQPSPTPSPHEAADHRGQRAGDPGVQILSG